MNKTALLTGITGQVGPYMARFLLDKGYTVYGMMRRTSHEDFEFVATHGLEEMKIIEGDLTDQTNLMSIVEMVQPDEIYNFGAQSHVGTSFESPEATAEITGLGVLRLLEAVRHHAPHAKLYQASSSEMFGDVVDEYQSEISEFRPMSPYAVSKVFGHYMLRVYREAYDLYACSGIVFNHESPRRGKRFVTRKITDWIGKYSLDPSIKPLELGYIDSQRDWGSAEDYVVGMWLMLQQDEPDDYVLATNETHSVREFCEIAFRRVGIDIEWSGEGINEIGVDQYGNTLVCINEEYYRPAEVPLLLGDATKAREKLGWKPERSFVDLVNWMVDHDVSENAVKN